MFYDAKNKSINIHGTQMDYVEFGHGIMPLVVLPGLGDGLKTVKGLAVTLAYSYRIFTGNFKVYMFSRKNQLPSGYTTRAMAEDLQTAFKQLNIRSAYVIGISQGGMIAQHLAIQYPDLVKKLILGVSISRPNDLFHDTLTKWIEMARADDYAALITDTCEHTYSPKMLKNYRPLYPLLKRVGKPKDFCRFLIQAESCLTHNTYDDLEKIQCPTLILGGTDDRITGKDSASEMAAQIPGSELILYEGYGHGAYEECKDFNRRILNFLNA